MYARAFDVDGDANSYDQDELDRIGEIWHRIAEDLAPFDIDVTTEEPSVFDSSTGRVLITEDTDETGAAMPYQGYGGVAYVGVWGYSNMQYYQPALVYFDNLGGGGPTFVSEASTHEAGHNLNLSHDGLNGPNPKSYYYGHGTGFVSWAPIMGVGYNNNVTQWSRGEYTYANNQQDDLAILDGLLGPRPDDHSDVVAGATALYVDGAGTISVTNPETDPDNALTDNKGVIENRDDVDMFAFSAGAGLATLSVTPAWDAYYRTSRRGANLDVHAALYDEFGTLLAESDPADDTDAYIADPVGWRLLSRGHRGRKFRRALFRLWQPRPVLHRRPDCRRCRRPRRHCRTDTQSHGLRRLTGNDRHQLDHHERGHRVGRFGIGRVSIPVRVRRRRLHQQRVAIG